MASTMATVSARDGEAGWRADHQPAEVGERQIHEPIPDHAAGSLTFTHPAIDSPQAPETGAICAAAVQKTCLVRPQSSRPLDRRSIGLGLAPDAERNAGAAPDPDDGGDSVIAGGRVRTRQWTLPPASGGAC
jgi:hypothetical protein